MKRWLTGSGHSRGQASFNYQRMQAWSAVVTAVATIIITGAAAYIALLQWRASEREVALELARSRPRYVGLLTPVFNNEEQARSLSTAAELKVTGNEITSQKSYVRELLGVFDAAEHDHPTLCVVELDTYWNDAKPSDHFAVQADVPTERLVKEPIRLPSGKIVYLSSFLTIIEHQYLNVFQEPTVDVVMLGGADGLRVQYGDDRVRVGFPVVSVSLLDLRNRGQPWGFELIVSPVGRGPSGQPQLLSSECNDILSG
jgi:hypothetical protein